MLKHFFDRMRGTERSPNRRPFAEIIWSWLGSFLGIYLVVFISQLTSFDNLFLVGSFGATAVLIYGAPLADFSQPRNLIGGHIISAIVGVAIYQSVPAGVALTGALAVSISIAAMHLTATMHPPGGATALIAVIGGEKVHILGY